MKKLIIALSVMFTLCTGFYFANNFLVNDDVKSINCPCTPDCKPGDAWCKCEDTSCEN